MPTPFHIFQLPIMKMFSVGETIQQEITQTKRKKKRKKKRKEKKEKKKKEKINKKKKTLRRNWVIILLSVS